MNNPIDFSDIKQYHADTKNVTSSMLKCLHESPLLYKRKYIDKAITTPTTSNMLLGSAIHSRILEPVFFTDRYRFEEPGVNRRTKAYKESKAEAESDGFTLLPDSDRKIIDACYDAVMTHPQCKKMIDTMGDVEDTLCWTDERSGQTCKARPDKSFRQSPLIFDIKTTQDPTPRAFLQTVVKYGYHLQAAHYAAGHANKENYDPKIAWFVFGVVRTTEPFDCWTYTLRGEEMEKSLQLHSSLLMSLMQRRRDNDWSMFGQPDLNTLTLPAWAFGEQK